MAVPPRVVTNGRGGRVLNPSHRAGAVAAASGISRGGEEGHPHRGAEHVVVVSEDGVEEERERTSLVVLPLWDAEALGDDVRLSVLDYPGDAVESGRAPLAA